VKSSSVAGQETLIGIVGRDFIILGADSSVSSSISLTSSNVDKIKVIVDPFPMIEQPHYDDNYNDEQQQVIAVASAGDTADSERLLGYLAEHVSSMEYQDNIGCDVKCIYHGDRSPNSSSGSIPISSAGLDVESVAHLARGMISQSLRSRGQLKTCLLIAGMTRCYKHVDVDVDVKGDVNLTVEEDMVDEGNSMFQHKNLEKSESSFSSRIQRQVQAATKEYNVNENVNVHGQTNERDDNETNDKNVNRVDHKSTTTTATFLKPKLFWLDEYGSLQNVEYAAHGLASNFALSILDRCYHSKFQKKMQLI
jgi:hypothetical protein